jgi:hypothetical protein
MKCEKDEGGNRLQSWARELSKKRRKNLNTGLALVSQKKSRQKKNRELTSLTTVLSMTLKLHADVITTYGCDA